MPFSGHVVQLKDDAFFLPEATDVPPLQWNAKEQRFDAVNVADGAGKAVVDALRALVPTAEPSIDKTVLSGDECVSVVKPCHALYGVLPLGACDAVLLYVTGKKRVASLAVESTAAPHDIFLVTGLTWLTLPSVPATGRPTAGPDADTDETAAMEKSSDDGEESGLRDGEPDRRLPRATLMRYQQVVEDFCAYVNENAGAHSFLYFSPTLNLAENPKDIIDAQLWARQDTPDEEHDGDDARSTSSEDGGGEDGADGTGARGNNAYRQGLSGPERRPQTANALFQWNLSLLQAFEPITPVFKSLATRRLPPGQATVKRATRNIAAFYVPSCIRGLARAVTAADAGVTAEMLMITRLSARFAGTRYNRRGLETGWSGVCANMAMTALWVSCGGTAPSTPRRLAVYEILRGSIPRHWTQPANLTFKPPIRMSSTNSALRELRAHLELLTRVFPQYDRYYMIDTTSTSKLERPLSDSFANTAIGLSTRDATGAEPTTGEANTYEDCFQHLRYNVKQKKKKMKYGEMRLNLTTVIEESLEDLHGHPTSPLVPSGGLWDGFLLYEQAAATEADGDSSAAPWQLLKEQVVLVRVNCLDNLDRTNLTQSMLVTTVLPNMLTALTRGSSSPDASSPSAPDAAVVRLAAVAEKATLTLFAAQGVSISQLYAGTDPHFLNYMLGSHANHVADMFSEGLLALRRWYNNNFHDGRKQDAVSLLTGQHNPVRYAAEIENPFSRDLSRMNRRVFLGLVVGFVALLVSLLSLMTAANSTEARIRLALTLLWAGYNYVLVRRLAPYQQSLTNRPLLAYAP